MALKKSNSDLEKSLQNGGEELAVLKKELDRFENEISSLESAVFFHENAKAKINTNFKLHQPTPQICVQNYLKKQLNVKTLNQIKLP